MEGSGSGFVEQERVWADAEAPLVAELHGLGLPVDSAWSLRTSGLDYTHALPMLLEHLERGGYPDRVAEGIAEALNVKQIAPYWSRVKELYLHAKGSGEQGALASVLGTQVNRSRIADLIELLGVKPDLEMPPSRDPRGLFIQPILRYGGEEGLRLVESLKDDPVFGREATALLKQREARRRRREAQRNTP